MEKLSNHYTEAMVCCIMQLYRYELEDTTTEDWTDIINRGSLWHVNDGAYYLFYLMQVQLRQHFCTNMLTNESSCANIVHVLLAQDELYVQWTITCFFIFKVVLTYT
jgi:hypothetical protein